MRYSCTVLLSQGNLCQKHFQYDRQETKMFNTEEINDKTVSKEEFFYSFQLKDACTLDEFENSTMN